jgi:hypothetical protein
MRLNLDLVEASMQKWLSLAALISIAIVSLGFLTNATLLPKQQSFLRSTPLISVDELHRSIDMNSLPVRKIEDPV